MTTPQTKTQFHCLERSFEKASPPADDYVAGCIIGKTIRLKSLLTPKDFLRNSSLPALLQDYNSIYFSFVLPPV